MDLSLHSIDGPYFSHCVFVCYLSLFCCIRFVSFHFVLFDLLAPLWFSTHLLNLNVRFYLSFLVRNILGFGFHFCLSILCVFFGLCLSYAAFLIESAQFCIHMKGGSNFLDFYREFQTYKIKCATPNQTSLRGELWRSRSTFVRITWMNF